MRLVQALRKRGNSQRGASFLLESVLAMALFTFILLAMAQMMALGAKGTHTIKDHSLANTLAQRYLEEFRGQGFFTAWQSANDYPVPLGAAYHVFKRKNGEELASDRLDVGTIRYHVERVVQRLHNDPQNELDDQVQTVIYVSWISDRSSKVRKIQLTATINRNLSDSYSANIGPGS